MSLLVGAGISIISCEKNIRTDNTAAQKVMYHCPMHPSYISEKMGDCPICGMKLVPINSDVHPSVGNNSDTGIVPENAIRIDPVTVQNIGVTIEKAQVRLLTKEISAGAVVKIDETHQVIVSTKISGWIEKLHVNYTGAKVHKGEPLFEIYSPELVSTQDEYLQAIRFARKFAGNDSSGATQLLESTRRRLMNWDITDKQLTDLVQQGKSSKTLTIYSPLSGVILEKTAIEGLNVVPGMSLYRIADLSTVWVIANVYQNDLPYVKIGMEASIEFQSQPGMIYSGKVQFIAPVFDQNTKTAQVRIEVKNSDGFDLKPDMFANVIIHSKAPVQSITVSEQSVIHTGTRTLVVVDIGNGYYKPLDVQLGLSANGYVQIVKGIEEGQSIVTSSQFLIDSESNLRAAVSKMSSSDSTGKVEKEQHKGHNMPSMKMESMPNDTSEMQMDAMEKDTAKQSVQEKTGLNKSSEKSHSENKNDVKVKYICPMKCEVSDKPGKCSVCGMELIIKE
jgi:RND family efflux transporter MFP subunit